METNADHKRCPQCEAELGTDAPEGLCPSCLLKQVDSATEGAEPSNPEPIELEELSRLFPELEIQQLIGVGGMGLVYQATQTKMGRTVALKILPELQAKNPESAERFAREAQVLAKLKHPNIVTLYDFGERGGIFYLVMEYIDGVNLRQAMQAARFTPQQALRVVPKICEALDYAHSQGVLHRDIKPANILVDTRGDVKLVDFGIAKLGGEKVDITLTKPGGALGTPQYMAPEQIENPSEVDHRADIYSLGVVLYEMLTGELPLGRFAAPSARAEVGLGVDSVVLRALEKERERRHQSASELRSDVETVSGEEGANGGRSSSGRPADDQPGQLGTFGFWTTAVVLIGYAAYYTLADLFWLFFHFTADSQANVGGVGFRQFNPISSWFGYGMAIALGVVGWNRRNDLVRRFPLRYGPAGPSLYRLALYTLFVGVLANSLRIFGPLTNYWSLGHGALIAGLGMTVLIVRGSEVKGRSNVEATRGLSLGTCLIWVGLVVAVVYRNVARRTLLFIDGNFLTESQLGLLSPGLIESASILHVLLHISLIPTGLALVGRSRTWRAVALWINCSAILYFTLLPFFMPQGGYQILQSGTPGFVASSIEFSSTMVILHLVGLGLLCSSYYLEVFGLRRKWVPLTGWSLVWAALAFLFVLATAFFIAGKLNILPTWSKPRATPLAAETRSLERVESYELELYAPEIGAVQSLAALREEGLVSVLAIGAGGEKGAWWDQEGALVNASDLWGAGVVERKKVLNVNDYGILIQFSERMTPPVVIHAWTVDDTGSIVGERLEVENLDSTHALVIVRRLRLRNRFSLAFLLTSQQRSPVASADSGSRVQDSWRIGFHWEDQEGVGGVLRSWLEAPQDWALEMWSETRSSAGKRQNMSQMLELQDDGILATFPGDPGPDTEFTLMVRPLFRQTIPELPTHPRTVETE